MKKLIVIMCLALLCGCRPLADATPESINDMARPVSVVAANSQGLVLMAGDGEIRVFETETYFSQAIAAAGFKRGDVIAWSRNQARAAR